MVPIGPEILAQFSHWVRVVFACAGIGLGLLVCCFGSRVIKLCGFLLGFGVGGLLGGVVAWRISLDDKVTVISCFVTGVVVGLLCVCVLKFGRYVGAACVGFLPVFLFIQTGGSKAFGGNIMAWCLLGAAVLVGALLLYFCRRYVMVLATAYAGALAAALGVGTFLPGQHVDAVQLVNNPTLARCVEWQCHLMAGAWVLLGTLGLIVQLLMFERPLTEAEIVEKARLVINGDAASVDSAGPAPRTKSSKSASKARGPAISYEELMHENKRLKAAMTRI